jgi:hypothetical protein
MYTHTHIHKYTPFERAQFSGCSSTTNAYSGTGQMAVCCQNLTLGALSSRSPLSMPVGVFFKKFGLFLNPPYIYIYIYIYIYVCVCVCVEWLHCLKSFAVSHIALVHNRLT